MSTQSHTLDDELPPEGEKTGDAPMIGASWASDHPVNIRLSFPFFRGRYYLAFVAGKERRGSERIKQERVKHPLATRGNIFVLASLGCITGLAIWAAFQVLSVLILKDLGMVVGG